MISVTSVAQINFSRLGDENEAKQRVGSNFSEYDNVVDLST